jgi:uracil-DNA glycosylase
MTFCDFNSLFGKNANRFYDIISKYFNQLPINTLIDFYKDFRNNFMTHPPLHPDGCIFHPRGMYNTPHQNLMTAYNQSNLVGIDLPSSLTNETNDQKIIIIGEDPIRDIEVSGKQPTYDIIGTPFGFHNYDIRNYKRPNYFNIVQGLIHKGYNVYCTDVFKIWIQDPNNNQAVDMTPDNELPNALNLLKKEINLVKPNYILLFGNEVQDKVLSNLILNNKYNNVLTTLNNNAVNKLLNNMKININNVQFISVPHPSTNAGKAWAKILGRGSTLNDRAEYIVNLFP